PPDPGREELQSSGLDVPQRLALGPRGAAIRRSKDRDRCRSPCSVTGAEHPTLLGRAEPNVRYEVDGSALPSHRTIESNGPVAGLHRNVPAAAAVGGGDEVAIEIRRPNAPTDRRGGERDAAEVLRRS